MARIRTIKPEFQNSQSMGRVSRDARLLFIELWPQCDDAGRIRANSRMLASILFPYDLDAFELIDGWLAELENENCITRYRIGNDDYLQVLHWAHQKIDHPKPSDIPPPPAKKVRKTKLSPREDSRGVANIRAVSSTVSSIGQEGNGEDSAEPPALAPAVILLPTNRFNSTGEEVGFSQAQFDDYASTFPAVDVPQQFREMRRWLIDNPDKRKTFGGMGKFVNTWLSREQDKPPPRPANSSSPFPVAQILKVV